MKRFLIIMSVVVVSASGCRRSLDINTNPNTSSSVEPKLLFNYAATNWSSNRASGDNWITLGLAAQTVASGGDFGFGKGNVYDIGTNAAQNVWSTVYQSTGHNLDLAIRTAESSVPANKNASAQCKILLAQVAFETSTLYGDIPFSEAWKDNISYPKFDAQKDVFEKVLSLLDEAIAEIDVAGALKISDYDLFYSGDMTKWVHYANSLKLKILMAMVDKDPSKAAAIGQSILQAKSISSAAENFAFPFYNIASKENPKYRLLKVYSSGANVFFYANSNVLDYMSQADPRMPVYFDKPATAKDFEGVESEQDPTDFTANYGKSLQGATWPEIILAYPDQLFFEAEAYARGLGVPADIAKATERYKKAVEESVKMYAGTGNYSAFLNTLPAPATANELLYQIHLQQWIHYMDRPQDAFLQWRRSGSTGNEVPVLRRPEGATAGKLFRRFVYAQDELNSNPNAPSPAPAFDENMWFDQ